MQGSAITKLDKMSKTVSHVNDLVGHHDLFLSVWSLTELFSITVWLQYFEGLKFRSLRVNPVFGNFYFRCMHYHLLVTE